MTQFLRQSRQMDDDDAFVNRDPMILFYGPDCKETAMQIIDCAAKFNENFSKKKLIKQGEITWGKFEDGMPNLFIRDVESIRGRDVVFLVSFLNSENFLSQFSVLYSLPRYLVKTLVIVMPYFPTGTMERVDEEGQIATAMTFAQLLCATPVGIGGPARLIIYDIHALQNRFYFSDSVIPILVSAVPLFLDVLKAKHRDEKIVIAFPDDGAHKRFSKQFKDFNLIICIKVRDGDKRIVSVKEGQEYVKDSHIFIVDDLVKTGGTLIETRDKLLQIGAKKVSCFVTHPVFPKDSWKRFIYPKDDDSNSTAKFSHFYTTDSVPDIAKQLADQHPFTIIPLAASIVDNVLRY